MNVSTVRSAKHAGSWYPAQKNILQKQMDEFFKNAKKQVEMKPQCIKCIISPHAGFKYSGPTAAFSYQYLQSAKTTRIILLGPSHHKYFKGISLSSLTQLQTPLGNIKVDIQCINQLKQQLVSQKLSKKDQEKQHSLEMHMPMIRRLFKQDVKVVPIIVGVIQDQLAQQYAKILVNYFDSPNTIFIVSSDFCHWGPHFGYQPFKQGVQIHEHIEQLDKQGMNIIQKNDTKSFDKYISQTGNTICGEYPIRIMMHTIKQSKLNLQTKFVHYDQSDKVKSFNGSSVSYAASITYIK